MLNDEKKVVIVGVGMVGMSFAYALLNQNICDELVLIDINKVRAKGEAADLSHGLPFAPSSMSIYAGDYSDCSNADLVVICAGAPQLEGESRRDLLKKNYNVFKSKKKLLKYVAVLEKQKRGAYHAHILLFNLPYIPYEKLQKIWKLGSVWINKVDIDSKDNRGRYITKYMEKGIAQELLENKGKKSYYSSNNLDRPTQLRILDDDSIDDLVADKFIAYQSEYISKVKVDGQWVENKVKYRKIKI